jgi:hypothetical protein
MLQQLRQKKWVILKIVNDIGKRNPIDPVNQSICVLLPLWFVGTVKVISQFKILKKPMTSYLCALGSRIRLVDIFLFTSGLHTQRYNCFTLRTIRPNNTGEDNSKLVNCYLAFDNRVRKRHFILCFLRI